MTIILKIPFNLALLDDSKRGDALAPDTIEGEMKDIFSTESGEEWTAEFQDVEIDNGNFEVTQNNITQATINALEKGSVVAIGGDHSISYGLMRGFSKKYPNAKLIFLDAHLDCSDDFLPPSHEDVLRAAINEGFFKPENILIIGTRNMHRNEIEFIREKKVKAIWFKSVRQYGREWIINQIKDFVEDSDFYVSIDIDVVDPKDAPGTGWREPGGFFANEIIQLVQEIPTPKMLDLVEISPDFDENNRTTRLGARILVEFLGKNQTA